jgi:hypothetical protein
VCASREEADAREVLLSEHALKSAGKKPAKRTSAASWSVLDLMGYNSVRKSILRRKLLTNARMKAFSSYFFPGNLRAHFIEDSMELRGQKLCWSFSFFLYRKAREVR